MSVTGREPAEIETSEPVGYYRYTDSGWEDVYGRLPDETLLFPYVNEQELVSSTKLFRDNTSANNRLYFPGSSEDAAGTGVPVNQLT